MLKKIIILQVTIIILLFSGCSSNNGPSEPASLIPLKVGNTWHYQMNTYDSLSHLKSTSVDTVKIISSNTNNGFTWYYYIIMSKEDAITSLGDGMYEMGNDTLGNLAPVMFLKYPVVVGDTWRYTTNLVKYNCTLTGKTETVVSNAGNFICYKYQADDILLDTRGNPYSDNRTYSWICPGKGIIRSENWVRWRLGNFFLLQSKVLQSYELK